MPFGDFCRIVSPLYLYDTWADAFDTLEEDRSERAIIDDLEIEWLRDGQFREPVRVTDGQLANGYHRVSASRRVGGAVTFTVTNNTCVAYDTNNTCVAYDTNNTCVAYDTNNTCVAYDAWVDFTVVVDDSDVTTGTDDYDDWICAAMAAARSVPYPGGWAESDGVSATGNELTVSAYVDIADADAVSAAIIERLVTLGYHAEVTAVAEASFDDE